MAQIRQGINDSEEHLCITLLLAKYLANGNKAHAIKECARRLQPETESPLMKQYLGELIAEPIEGMVIFSLQQLEIGLRKDNLL